ncbi:hypothetical protein GCM10010399_40700 [Dactylosporangium fulvum]|uniref:Glycerophosphoryl diester phosphodiesterase membrane domain-containing protein n=1 Tax=Dactylosporangium fulvum TaxID=53359 RepID=A0ABY5W2S0_9ACTN|nr:hypothetical protein [Dactylosporangium fulvum]UWP84303.1 hypothetical protein Dfulv_08720 [Dactylosporangium fulvum]
MTQPPPPGPEQPAQPPFSGQGAAGPPAPFDPTAPAAPAPYDPAQPGGAPAQAYWAAQGQPAAPQGFGPPSGYDPSTGYPVYYQAAPTGGYGVPVFGQQAGYDPLISPDYGGWWKRAMAVLKPGWKLFAGLQAIGVVMSLLFVIPQALYLVYLQDRLPRTNSDGVITTTEVDLTPFLAVLGITVVGIFLTYLVQFAITIASNHVGVSIAAGLKPSLGMSLSMAAKRVFPLLGWQFLAGLIILAGVCACVLPAIYLTAVFMVLPAVVTFERTNVISRCFQLFHRDLGASISRIATIAGISIGVAIIGSIIAQVVQLGFGGAQALTSDFETSGPMFTTAVVVGVVVSSVISSVLAAAGSVLTAPLTLTAYADLRARVETLSTATLAAEIGIAAPATPEWGTPSAV